MFLLVSSGGLHSRQSQKNTMQVQEKQKAPFGAFVVFVFCFSILLLSVFIWLLPSAQFIRAKVFPRPCITGVGLVHIEFIIVPHCLFNYL